LHADHDVEGGCDRTDDQPCFAEFQKQKHRNDSRLW
jgi:hypothetical protein